jgi:hypothetical protein
MDEFGEERKFYVWPTDHEDGEPYPDDFYEKVTEALRVAGFDSESC